jgi:hypothetical protein
MTSSLDEIVSKKDSIMIRKANVIIGKGMCFIKAYSYNV